MDIGELRPLFGPGKRRQSLEIGAGTWRHDNMGQNRAILGNPTEVNRPSSVPMPGWCYPMGLPVLSSESISCQERYGSVTQVGWVWVGRTYPNEKILSDRPSRYGRRTSMPPNPTSTAPGSVDAEDPKSKMALFLTLISAKFIIS